MLTFPAAVWDSSFRSCDRSDERQETSNACVKIRSGYEGVDFGSWESCTWTFPCLNQTGEGSRYNFFTQHSAYQTCTSKRVLKFHREVALACEYFLQWQRDGKKYCEQPGWEVFMVICLPWPRRERGLCAKCMWRWAGQNGA